MSILIKGMERPANCAECNFCSGLIMPDEIYMCDCPAETSHGRNITTAIEKDERPNWCPLVEAQEPHWIPVTERLPESTEDDLEYPTVLVCFDNGDVDTACFYESTREWGCGDMYDRICHPIAWIPLPEPYKEVTT